MSTFYYLACKKHQESILITDNKGNDWFDRYEWREFQFRHVYEGCDIVLMDEYRHDNMPCLEIKDSKLYLAGKQLERQITPDDSEARDDFTIVEQKT